MKTTTAQTETQHTLPALRNDNQTQAAAQNELPLTVSALICTRNRAGSIARAARSVLENADAQTELIIVDQSADEATAEALAPFRSDSRLRYLRVTTQGKSAAVNAGVAAAKNEIIVMTDDDCVALSGWAAAHAQVFRDNPQVACAFGNVLPPEYDAKDGFTPVYQIKQDSVCRSMNQKLRARGIGANMAIRRSVALRIGGFDTELGPGSQFRACEDGDFAARCLLAGFYLYETQGSAVIHYGFRTWAEGRQLTRDAFLGIGAAYIKPLKCGKFSVIPLLAYEFWTYALYPSLRATLTLRKPLNWQRVLCFLRGATRGLLAPVDRKTLLYRPKNS